MRPATQKTYKERILEVLVHIQTHLGEAISLEDLAGVAHFSPFHFHRIFRGMVGESVKEHVRRLRLERAAHRLKFTDLPVTRLAFDAGYETHESFTRAFHAMFDVSPSQFRATHRALPWPYVASGVHFDPDGYVADFQPQTGGPPMQVRLETRTPLRVAFMRHVGPYADVGGSWMQFMTWAGMRGLLNAAPTLLGVVHDDPEVTPPDKVRYDACIPVDDRFVAEGDIGVQTIEGGEYAVATHRGPYRKLGETYARLCGEWLPASGRELRACPSFEVYRNSPMSAAPEELLTDIYLPLQ